MKTKPYTLRSSRNFELRETNGRYYVRLLSHEKFSPRCIRVNKADRNYLMSLKPDSSFENACVIDIGVGIWTDVAA